MEDQLDAVRAFGDRDEGQYVCLPPDSHAPAECKQTADGRRATALTALILFVGLTCVAQGQTALENGARHVGEITPAGDTDSWTFTANAGDAVQLRIGSTNFTPRIRLFDTDNALIGETTSGNTFTRDGFLSLQATNGGNYTVLVSATFPNQSGTYGFHFALAPGSFVVSPGDEGGALSNGAVHNGGIELGDLDMWSFTANAGDQLLIRMGAPALTPWIRLYGPTGALVGEVDLGNTFARDNILLAQATNAGPHTVVVGAKYAGQIGEYTLTLAQAPGEFTVSEEDEGGALTNGFAHLGAIALGDLDMWSFGANAGDSLFIRVGSDLVTPWIHLYGPTGALVGEVDLGNTFARDNFLLAQATNAGPHTVVVGAKYPGQTGDYSITLAQAPGAITVSPGDEGGALTNGVAHSGVIAVGDLDVWGFDATAGDSLMIRVGATNFTPWIQLYGPTGALVGQVDLGNTFLRDNILIARAADSGPHTVVVSAKYPGQLGEYGISLAKAPGEFIVAPGDDGGVLTNGFFKFGAIDLGDLDVWSLEANAGDNLFIRVGATNVTPWIHLYGPTGALVGEANLGNTFARDNFLLAEATNAGPHTVVVGARHSGQLGPYLISLARAPAEIAVGPRDEGGPLTNGFTHLGALELGDVEVWSFWGTPGDSNVLRAVSTNFTPWIRLYGPNGALVGEAATGNTFARENTLRSDLTDAGVYTAILTALHEGQSGTYGFKQSRVPPDIIVPATTDVSESTALNLMISAQDPDEPVKPLVFTLISGPPGLTLTTSGATNATLAWTTTEADGPGTNQVVASVTDLVNGQSFIRTNHFDIIVREVNTAPMLILPANQELAEMTPLNASASADDPDLPANPVTFSLLNSPAGMTIDSATGAISWAPSEEQGPGAHVVTVVATDSSPSAINAIQLSVTNAFTVTVSEVNQPPQLSLPPPQAVDELSALNVSVSAVDPDLPANSFTFALVTPPEGMTINPATGAIAWTPTEAQGPSTNSITVIVNDDGAPSLSASASFDVMVSEVNSAPVPGSIVDSSVHFGALLSVQAEASDADLPANAFTYSLDQAPDGLGIDAATGLINWTPSETQVGNHTVTVRIADDATPSLSATTSFQVTVTGEGSRMDAQRLTSGLVQITISGDIGQNYELQKTSQLRDWERVLEFRLDVSPFQYIEPESTSGSRFYRLRLIPAQ